MQTVDPDSQSSRQHPAAQAAMPPCLNCGSSNVVQSRSRSWFESKILRLMLHRPYRCRTCGVRFYGFFLVSWLALLERTLERRLSKTLIVLASWLLVVVLGYLDFKTGYELSLAIFYLVPIAVTSWVVGRKAGILTAFACAGTWLYSDLAAGHRYSSHFLTVWNAGWRLGFFLIVASLLASRKRIEEEREALISELKAINIDEKTMRGGLVICACGKKVRKGEGEWKEIEAFLRARSEAGTLPPLCPECEKKTARRA
jgi:hypothetical protein